MKRIIIPLLAVVSVSSVALAADLPGRRVPPPVVTTVPLFTWTGFYVGVNAGYGFNGDDLKSVNFNNFYAPSFSTAKTSDDGSFTGGIQAGYNYQMGNAVFGLEADFNYLGAEKKFVANTLAANGGILDELSAHSEAQWFGTLRPRLGFTPVDRLLVYATGGLAYGQVKTRVNYTDFSGYTLGGSTSDTRIGWTVGAGAEYAITNNITVKGEYAYVDLGNEKITVMDPGGNFVHANDPASFHIIRAGVNYKF